VLDEGELDLQPLPSDEAWFGEPDPSIYAAGTNDLTKEQLAEEVAKGNVCTLRQLKQHLATASDKELEVREGEARQAQQQHGKWCKTAAGAPAAAWPSGQLDLNLQQPHRNQHLYAMSSGQQPSSLLDGQQPGSTMLYAARLCSMNTMQLSSS
jgi:hypothetical protein